MKTKVTPFLMCPVTGRRVLLEQLPYAPVSEPAAKTYRTHRLSKDLQIWLPENRFYRSPNSAPDGPDKSIWGFEQKQWLMPTLGWGVCLEIRWGQIPKD